MRQSSAKRRRLDVIPVGRSLMNLRKSNGPRTVPWDTPEGTGTQSDDFPITTTRWDRHVINLLITSVTCHGFHNCEVLEVIVCGGLGRMLLNQLNQLAHGYRGILQNLGLW